MKSFLKEGGWKSMMVICLLVLGLVMVAQVVKVNLDNRSKADEINNSEASFKMTDTVSGVYQSSQDEEEIADSNQEETTPEVGE